MYLQDWAFPSGSAGLEQQGIANRQGFAWIPEVSLADVYLGRVIWDDDAPQRNGPRTDSPTEWERFCAEYDRIIPDHRAFLMLPDDDPFEMTEVHQTTTHSADSGNTALALPQRNIRVQTQTTTPPVTNATRDLADSHLPSDPSSPHLISPSSTAAQTSGSRAQTGSLSADSVGTPISNEDGISLSSPELFVEDSVPPHCVKCSFCGFLGSRKNIARHKRKYCDKRHEHQANM